MYGNNLSHGAHALEYPPLNNCRSKLEKHKYAPSSTVCRYAFTLPQYSQLYIMPLDMDRINKKGPNKPFLAFESETAVSFPKKNAMGIHRPQGTIFTFKI